MAKNVAIIFAGGSGVRMGSGLPKQFLEINGKPIIVYTLEIFDDHPEIDEIIVACKAEYIDRLKKLIKRFALQKVTKIVAGGTTGQDSIYNGLTSARASGSDDDIVLIHDGVRPYITGKLISANIESVRQYRSAITCTEMYETPILSEGGVMVEGVVERNKMYTAQAPQSFYLGDILQAHEIVRADNRGYEGIVDSCSLMRNIGKDVSIVKGNRGNIKVTTPEDLYLFRGLLSYRETEQGFGFSDGEYVEV